MFETLPIFTNWMSEELNAEWTKLILEAYEPNPEELLNALGFGPSKYDDVLMKIPSRFLRHSKVIIELIHMAE